MHSGFFWRQDLSLLDRTQNIFRLIKFGLAISILFTVVPGFFMGPALPSWTLITCTLIGTLFIACSSFAYNQIIERDKDVLMERTKKRPLIIDGGLSLGLSHGIASGLLGIGFYIMYLGSNPLAAWIALASFLYYIFIYTILLKSRTHWNTFLGGVCGSLGPLIGEASVSGSISEYGIMMFLFLFLWQPPHFWCLAIRYRDDYKKATIPTLTSVKGIGYSLNQILLYQGLLCICIVLSVMPPFSLFGPIFLWPSLVIGLVVFYFAFLLRQKWFKNKDFSFSPMRVFFLTITHMIVWHIALGLDLYFRLWRA